MSLAVKGLLGLAVFLVGLGAYTVLATWRIESNYPPLGKFVEVSSGRLHYLDAGEGVPIVLLHGASASLRDFQASILPELAKKHRVIAFDRPGYGYSERIADGWLSPAKQAAIIREALEKIGADRPIIVGHSWAGSVALAYALDYPDEISGAVLLAGAVNSWETGVSWSNSAAGIAVVGPVFSSTIVFPAGQALLESAVSNVFSPEQPPAGYLERTGAILAIRPGAFRSSAEDVRNLSAFLELQERRYDKIEVPLLLVTGEKDTIVPAWNHADRLAKRLPDAKLVELEGAGHALHHSRRDMVIHLIDEFIQELPTWPSAQRSAKLG
ncbi:MAG: alpha/beta hydrolase [Stappiaceae bacterium]